jgi:hypothetical protein
VWIANLRNINHTFLLLIVHYISGDNTSEKLSGECFCGGGENSKLSWQWCVLGEGCNSTGKSDLSCES